MFCKCKHDCCHCSGRFICCKGVTEEQEHQGKDGKNCKCDKKGCQLQLWNRPLHKLNDGDIIMFDSTVVSNNPDITYGHGEFTVLQPMMLSIFWNLVTDGSDKDTNISFSIAVNGINYAITTSNIVTGQISGNALINASAGDVITLVNSSGQTIVLGDVSPQVNIVII